MNHFKIFYDNGKLNKQLEKAGFEVYKYREVFLYTLSDPLKKSDDNYMIPEKYKYKCDDSIWSSIGLSYFERDLCLMREPELDFDHLWELFITTNNEHDEIGSISIILDKYNKELLRMLTELLQNNNNNNINRVIREKMRMIRRHLKYTSEGLYTKSIEDILKKV